jgi:hypothetical protein
MSWNLPESWLWYSCLANLGPILRMAQDSKEGHRSLVLVAVVIAARRALHG